MVVSRRETRTPASSSSSAITTMSSAKRKLVISRHSMLTIPLWSSNVSHMILSRKMLKKVGEGSSMLIKMYLPFHGMCLYMYSLYIVLTVNFMQMLTQSILSFNTTITIQFGESSQS